MLQVAPSLSIAMLQVAPSLSIAMFTSKQLEEMMMMMMSPSVVSSSIVASHEVVDYEQGRHLELKVIQRRA
jgi:hypothetical protein